MGMIKTSTNQGTLVQEMVGDEIYEYYPLGEYIVAAPGICGGRPTFKYTRLEVAPILELLAGGWSIDKILYEYAASDLSYPAIQEAISLAKDAFVKLAPVLPLAV